MQREQTGRFYNSFVVKMIRDFSLLLALLFLIEMSVRLGLSLYEFYTQDQEDTQLAADRLASDIKDIMLNSGGPVASRTIYPILKRNYQKMGFSIAVEPSDVTFLSIRKLFNIQAHGIPAQWRAGRSHAASRELKAEAFCLQCHVDAKEGDVLGRVEVRRYLSDHLSTWWHEVRLTGLLMLGKIGLDLFVLYLLLRLRMEPLMNLRAVVGALTKSNLGLSRRASVNSHDEFGELAMHINDLLDRVTTVMGDLLGLLNQVVAVNGRLSQSSKSVVETFAEVDACVHKTQLRLHQYFHQSHERTGRLFQQLDSALKTAQQQAGLADKSLINDMTHATAALKAEVDTLNQALVEMSEPLASATESGHQLKHYLLSIDSLEERLTALAENGRELLKRLS